jgi:hypothetical protein
VLRKKCQMQKVEDQQAKKVYCDTMLVNTGSGARLKNVARLRDIIVNWCTGGCWFTLAE